MKKGVSLLLAGALALGTLPAVSEAAAAPSFVSVIVNGNKVWFPDAQPFVNNDYRTMVPVRFVTERLGADVKWLGETQTVAIQYKGKDIKLRIGQPKATVNGVDTALDTTVILHNNRTFVPLRFVTETLAGEVTWDGYAQAVQIKTDVYDVNAQYDEYGRKIRTTGLPKNAANYPYILEDIPNEFYEMRKFEEPDGVNVLTTKQLYNTYEYSKANIDLWMERVRKHYSLLLNVDYRTINQQWIDEIYQYRNTTIDHKYEIEEYVNWVRQNKIIIEGYVDPEPSMILGSKGDGSNPYIPAKVKFRFVEFNQYEELLFDLSFKHAKQGPFEKGVWYEGYVDIETNSMMGGDWAPYLMVSSWAMLFNNAILHKVQ